MPRIRKHPRSPLRRSRFSAVSLLLLLALPLAAPGCSSPGERAARLLETAAFEERQNNFLHASKISHQIMEKYPDTAAATAARERLDRISRGDVEGTEAG